MGAGKTWVHFTELRLEIEARNLWTLFPVHESKPVTRLMTWELILDTHMALDTIVSKWLTNTKSASEVMNSHPSASGAPMLVNLLFQFICDGV